MDVQAVIKMDIIMVINILVTTEDAMDAKEVIIHNIIIIIKININLKITMEVKKIVDVGVVDMEIVETK
jgi:hypothetical protein